MDLWNLQTTNQRGLCCWVILRFLVEPEPPSAATGQPSAGGEQPKAVPFPASHKQPQKDRGTKRLECQSQHLSHSYRGEVLGYWFLSSRGKHGAVSFCAWSLSHWKETFSVWVISVALSHIWASLGSLMSNNLLDLSWLMSKTSQQFPVRCGMSESLTHWNVE